LEYLLDDRHRPLYLILSSSILLRGHWNISWMTVTDHLSNIMVCGGHPGDIPMSSEEDRG
jgi:hypothetical protein